MCVCKRASSVVCVSVCVIECVCVRERAVSCVSVCVCVSGALAGLSANLDQDKNTWRDGELSMNEEDLHHRSHTHSLILCFLPYFSYTHTDTDTDTHTQTQICCV